jgi:hypothetical protein
LLALAHRVGCHFDLCEGESIGRLPWEMEGQWGVTAKKRWWSLVAG